MSLLCIYHSTQRRSKVSSWRITFLTKVYLGFRQNVSWLILSSVNTFMPNLILSDFCSMLKYKLRCSNVSIQRLRTCLNGPYHPRWWLPLEFVASSSCCIISNFQPYCRIITPSILFSSSIILMHFPQSTGHLSCFEWSLKPLNGSLIFLICISLQIMAPFTQKKV